MTPRAALLATLLVCGAFYDANSKVANRTEYSGIGSHPAAEEGAALPRDNTLLVVGELGPEDVQYFDFNQDYEADPEDFMNSTITLVTYPGYITYIVIFEVGESQGATASIVSGGLGTYLVTVNLQSQMGRGYNITTQAYGWYFEPESTTTEPTTVSN